VDRERLLDLLDAHLDARLEDGTRAELEREIRDSADARSVYWQYCRQHALVRELEQERAGERLSMEPAASAAGAVPRKISRWIVAAAAGVLLALGAAGYRTADRLLRSGPQLDPGESLLVLPSGSQVIQKPGARIRLSGGGDQLAEVVNLDEGEIEIRAVKPGSGRRAVRVVTALGSVESVGTIFSVGLGPRERKETRVMKAKGVVPLVAAFMLVSVMEGSVLVRSGLGATEVKAGETAKVEKAKGEEAGEAVGGLQLNFNKRVMIRKSVTFVEKDGKRVEVKDPDAREHRRVELLAELKNVSDKPIAFRSFSKYVIPQAGELRAPWVRARDADGKEVPERKLRTYTRRHRGDQREKPAVFSITILKPGQSLALRAYTHTLEFPRAGRYKLSMAWKSEPAKALEAAGVKLWSGELKSNTVEWEYEDRAKAWRDRMERHHGKKAEPKKEAPPAVKKAEPPNNEAF
jgi:hypothetical protein